MPNSLAAALRLSLAEDQLPPADADPRLDRLADWSPVYRQTVQHEPGLWAWLEHQPNRDEEFRYSAFASEWEQDTAESAPTPPRAEMLNCLRRFRRRMLLRVAYREVNELAAPPDSARELTLLAEFILNRISQYLWPEWERRLGTPHCDETEQPARYTILALGKFGGRELNFFSDLDLIYLYEGQGTCLREGRKTRTATSEFFQRFFRDLTAALTEPSSLGPLFNIDLRLRPDGESSPIARSATGMEHYYSARGQTWERLAFLKARPVAGDYALAGDILDDLHPFRYPRQPPPHLVQEVAGLKMRIEKEVVGADNLDRDIKSGTGGIREIEFLTQTLQILNAGKNPFLQTGETLEALSQLERYQLLDAETAHQLSTAYTFLRLVENRLQMRTESRTHELPSDGEEREALARSLGFGDAQALTARLDSVRSEVHTAYTELFKADSHEAAVQEWTLFLSGHPPSPYLAAAVQEWFPCVDSAAERLRLFALGDSYHPIAREHVTLIMAITAQFADILPGLARPMVALERVSDFAEAYGARKQFFKTCAENPSLLKTLCRLFDRSHFIHELLCKYPGIMEELLHEAPQRQKSIADMRGELEHLPSGEDFPRLLWLYVKAEQVRIAIGELLYDHPPERVETALSHLATAACLAVLDAVDPENELTVVALGKFGGNELAFGSDLDLLFLGSDATDAGLNTKARRFRKWMQFNNLPGRTYEVDTRLRPYGQDGPEIVTLSALRQYHQPGGGAQLWERQLLTRARVLQRDPDTDHPFEQLRQEIVYGEALTASGLAAIWDMRMRVEKEKAAGAAPPETAFKQGPGGLMDSECLAQILHLRHGHADPGLRHLNTRETLRYSGLQKYLPAEDACVLLKNYGFLRQIELLVRRDENAPVTTLSADPTERAILAKWLGYPDEAHFFQTLKETMRQNRELARNFLSPMFPIKKDVE